MNPLALIMIAVGSVMALIVSTYILLIFSHPEDNRSCVGWLGRIVVIISLLDIFLFVLLLPLDVANLKFIKSLNMDQFYLGIFLIHCLLMLLVIPFSFFLYETDDDLKIMARLCKTLFKCIFLLIILGLLCFLMYWINHEAEYC